VPVDLQVDFGAGEALLDLEDLQASALQVNGGVGEASVTLPAKGNYNATVNGAIGSIVIIVPEELGVRLDTDAALVSVQVPPGYRKEGDVYLSPGYESAQNRVNLNAGLAIGSIQIEER
jgi:predicted membrane protein